MKGKKISNTLSILTPNERLRLVKFVKGEVSGKETELVRMMELAAKKNAILWEDSKVWKALYGSLTFDQQKYNHNCSRLLALISPFLPILHFLRDESRVELARLQIFNQKETFSEFERLCKDFSKSFTDKQYATPEDQFLDFQIQLEKHRFLVSNPQIHLQDNLAKVTPSFDLYWVIQKLQLACYNSVHEKVIGGKIPDPFLPQLNYFLDNNPSFSQVPIIRFYRILYQLIESDSIAGADLFVDFIRNQKHELPFAVVSGAFDLLMNYLIRCLNMNGNDQQVKNLITFIYDWGFSDQWVYLNGRLRPEHFKNRALLFIRMEQYEETKQFIETHQDKLDDSIRADLVELVNIHLNLRQNKLEGLEIRISSLRFTNPLYQISLKILRLQVRYQNYWNKPGDYLNFGTVPYLKYLIGEIKNIITFISKSKSISEYHKNTYCTRLSYMARLINAENYPEALVHLKQEVQNVRLDDSSWILQQIDVRLTPPAH
ncbi:MAG: hypothetical protein SF052_26035 [Bacteroidia bacterium]|nr:hypothetical protein [Bacteroidia bacterium]